MKRVATMLLLFATACFFTGPQGDAGSHLLREVIAEGFPMSSTKVAAIFARARLQPPVLVPWDNPPRGLAATGNWQWSGGADCYAEILPDVDGPSAVMSVRFDCAFAERAEAVAALTRWRLQSCLPEREPSDETSVITPSCSPHPVRVADGIFEAEKRWIAYLVLSDPTIPFSGPLSGGSRRAC
jgi:hypothetical protein